MGTSRNSYFERFSFCEAQIAAAPQPDLGLVVVIPCFDEPDLSGCLESLWQCDRPSCAVEVLVVVNGPIGCDPRAQAQNDLAFKEASEWATRHYDPRFSFQILQFPNLPRKHAGVGLARKIGMDEAARRFDQAEKPQGIIASFDADCRCDTNYLAAIEGHFRQNPRCPGCSIYFEHPLDGPLEPRVYDAIAAYELHLRYYVRALRWAGFPHAHHTIGSSMAVRADVYKKQGGMNKRQAGEDFYFLHKVIPLGGFADLTSTRVIPSPRPSDRVPFGTGKAVLDFLREPKSVTYPMEAFADLKRLFETVSTFHSDGPNAVGKITRTFSEALRTFLEKQNLAAALDEIRKNTSDEEAFRKRFFRWFNAFTVMKFVHHARDNSYGERKLEEEAAKLLRVAGTPAEGSGVPSAFELLRVYRRLDAQREGAEKPVSNRRSPNDIKGKRK
ncbi:MAG: glycosyltransferase family 2 protein [Verrucomicrobia bacterium]|nr:glycosyltransferase family 2 protein [Verrucomicrobiota bacterium]